MNINKGTDENLLLATIKFIQQKEYWVGQLTADGDTTRILPFNKSARPGEEHESVSISIPPAVSQWLIKISKNSDLSIYLLLMTALNTLVWYYTGNEDISVISPIYKRKISPDTLNTRLVVRNALQGETTFKELLLKIRQTTLKAYENQDYPFDKLREYLLQSRRISDGEALSHILCSMTNIHMEKPVLESCDPRTLVFSFNREGEALDGRIMFHPGVYEKELLESLPQHLVNILEAAQEDLNLSLNRFNVLSEGQREQLLDEFNRTAFPLDENATILSLFGEQVEKAPGNVAVGYNGNRLTYKQLDEGAGRLAAILMEKGVKPGHIVGILAERSVEMMVGVMGILKAGGAYMPVDPEYPEERKKYLLNDSGAEILLTQKHILEQDQFLLESIPPERVLILDDPQTYSGSVTASEASIDPGNPAYVIYTSGTTGRPKGVVIRHRNVCNLVTGLRERIYKQYDGALNVALLAPYVFDASVKQIFGALLLGHGLHIVPEEARIDATALVEFYHNHNIHVSDGTPTHLNLLSEVLKEQTEELKVKHFIIGGEALPRQAVELFFSRFGDEVPGITNVYGPTECTVDATSYHVTPHNLDRYDTVPLGPPMPNFQVYILGNGLTLRPAGIPGELCIGGKSVGRGYLNNLALTRERFIPNPFDNEQIIYRSGDLARWLPDGNLEFLGRIDQQVKIRGFRVELGEIENQLLSHPDINEAVVVAKEKEADSEKYLCAYYVADRELESSQLRAFLGKLLPDYIIPSYFMPLDKIPLTINGKTDRKALPEPLVRSGKDFAPPENSTQKKIVDIWSEVLAVKPENIGIDANFFDLGGHSLKATILAARIHKSFNIKLPLAKIFREPTVRQLSQFVREAVKERYTAIEPAPVKDYYVLSSAQRRMYILQQMDPGSTAYNMPMVLPLKEDVDILEIQDVFNRLISRHEMLRTSFIMKAGKPVQQVREDAGITIQPYKSSKAGLNDLIREFIQPFDLSHAPLLRVGWVEMEDSHPVLMLDLHHIVSDGVSHQVLKNEFIDLYHGRELPLPRIQYKDYAHWQNGEREKGFMRTQEEFWLREFAGEIPMLNLPMDYTRSTIYSFKGSRVETVLDEEQTGALKQLAAKENVTLYMALIALINILLSRLSGSEDIIIGSPVAARRHADLQGIVGMFVNTLALRNQPSGDKSFKQFLREIKERTLEAFENQEYQFEDLVEKLAIRRDTSHNPLFDVMFTLQTQADQETPDNSLSSPQEDVDFYRYENPIAKFDLNINCEESGGKLYFTFEYCTTLFKEDTVRRFIDYFENLVDRVPGSPGVNLADIDMLSGEERQRLLYHVNDTAAEYPMDRTLHQLFEAQVEKTPAGIAVYHDNMELTYDELNRKANRLARLLRDKGVGPDSIAAIMADPSPRLLVGILAVLKAGGGYLPIDSRYPADRVGYILRESRSQWLLTDSPQEAFNHGVEIINLEDIDSISQPDTGLEHINSPDHIAYVIYTSGTTGKPKGVVLPHRGVVDYIWWAAKNYIKDENIAFPLYSSISFDLTVTSLFAPLLTGNSIYIYDDEYRELSIEKVLEQGKVGCVKLTPSHLKLVKNKNKHIQSIKRFIVGGEQFETRLAHDIHQLFNGQIEIYNEYGPTEASVGCMIHRFDPASAHRQAVPIGVPADNTRVYILDRYLKPVPVGVVGEMYVGGDRVARGYLNKVEMTHEKFIPNPFCEGDRLYRTGDLARMMPDGVMEFVGRADQQVKVRGFRIELGEIEDRLAAFPLIREAVVIVDEDKTGEKFLCAYVAADEIDAAELRDKLSRELPTYMIPAYFVKLDKIPLTANGKLDLDALPKPRLEIDRSQVEKGNQTEQDLARIWGEILEIDPGLIGIDANFFELGGHSLKATTLASNIHKYMEVNISLTDVFRAPTLRGLAQTIENAAEKRFSSIQPAEEKDSYPLSSAQKRLFLIQQMEVDAAAYNMPNTAPLDESVDIEKLENAFKQLIQRHESLRTSFEMREETPVQIIHPEVDFNIREFQADSPEQAGELLRRFVRPFDLSRAPLLRAGILRTPGGENILMVDIHHIVSDGISQELLIEQLTALYSGRELPPLRLQYKDFAAWENLDEQQRVMETCKQYWINQFRDELPVLTLPLDYERPPVQSFEGTTFSFSISKDLTRQLLQVAAQQESTRFMTLLAVFYIWLWRLSGNEDIVVGTPVAGRRHADLQPIIGMFVNTLAMRNFPRGDKDFNTFLEEVKERTLDAFDNQDFQFEELVETISLKRDVGRNPLFDVVFTFEELDTAVPTDASKDTRAYSREIAKFDITFNALLAGEEFVFTIEYCTKLFAPETIQRFARYFEAIVSEIVRSPGNKLAEIEILDDNEKKQLTEHFNQTRSQYPADKTIQQLFREQVRLTPDQIAVSCDSEELTYEELNHKSDQLAAYLSQMDVRDQVVGLMGEPSIHMIVGILAILKAGAGYLPIDADYPAARKMHMLKDSNVNLLLTTGEESLPGVKQTISLNSPEIYNSGESFQTHDRWDNPAYVIYTSGSTGIPKGVVVNHRSVIRLVKNTNFVNLLPHDRILQTGALAFDASTFEIWGALLNGLTLYLTSKENILDPAKLKEIVTRDKITTMWLTAPLYNQLVDTDAGIFKTLRNLLVGGDVLSPPHIDKLRKKYPSVNIINGYGPTENTTFSTTHLIDREYHSRIPIGKPIANSTAYIVDKYNRLQPLKTAGELLVGGDGLALGYLNDPALTAQKFIRNPFKPGERLYRTGDLVCWLEDGSIQFIGRMDDQVKIRGFRVEPGEVEKHLLMVPHINNAVVVVRSEASEKYLCAYIVSGETVDTGQLKSTLAGKFPDYMVPRYFIQLEQIPLTPNGKVDKKALPEPQLTLTGDNDAPRSLLEEQLVEIWCDVLQVEKEHVGMNSDFFELGGHSLKAAVVVTRIHKTFDVKIPMVELFSKPTVRELSGYIRTARQEKYASIGKAETQDYYKLSSAQKRLYILNQIAPDSLNYNIPTVYCLEGEIDKEKLEDTFARLVERHESLRTSFRVIDEEPLQEIHDRVDFEMEFQSLENPGASFESPEVRDNISTFVRPFELTRPPLLRVRLLRLETDKHVLMVDMHHIISDGTSMTVFAGEFAQLYEGAQLPSLPLQYKDFSQWQNNLLETGKIAEQEKYWLDMFNGGAPRLNLPTDYPRPEIQSFEGDVISFQVDNQLMEKVRNLMNLSQATLYMVLMAAFNLLLSKFADTEDIVVGSSITGRNHADLQHIIGMFVNMLSIRNKPENHLTFLQFLSHVKENVLGAFENQDYQFDELVEKLGLQGATTRNPLFDTAFVLQNFNPADSQIENQDRQEGLKVYPYSYGMKIAKFDLLLVAVERADCINITLEYATGLFKKETVENIANYYIEILKQVTGNSDIMLKDIALSHQFTVAKSSILDDIGDDDFTF